MKRDALVAKWEARLEAEGLGVLDQARTLQDRKANRIRTKDNPKLDPRRAVEYAALNDYYLMAERFTDQIEEGDDQAIWRLHAQGLEAPEIKITLNLVLDCSAINYRIKRLRRQMES